MTAAASFHRPLLLHRHFSVSRARFLSLPFASRSCMAFNSSSAALFLNTKHLQALSSSSSSSSLFFLAGRSCALNRILCQQQTRTRLQSGNSISRDLSVKKVTRRLHTKTPTRPVVEEEEEAAAASSDMVKKKELSAQPRQLALRTTSTHANSTLSFVQILGTGMDTGDTAPSVLLFFDQRRFIFNAGEGLQRFCIEHKIKLSKINHIFLTRVSSETGGGLPGLLLTLANIGEVGMAVNIWGTSDLQYLVNAMRTFVPNASVVHTHSFGPTVSQSSASQPQKFATVLLEDDVVKISAVLLWPESSEVKGTIRSQDKRDDELSVVYVCELPEVKGKFDPSKAEAFFNRPGPHYGLLQAGKSVMGSDGKTMVHPSDVMDPSSPGPIFILVDCPALSYIPALLSAPDLCCLQEKHPDTGSPLKQVTLMVHISPASVTTDARYQKWMLQFEGAQHVLAGHDLLNMASPILQSSARVLARLNCICPQVFPISNLQSNVPIGEAKLSSLEVTGSGFLTVAENLLKFRLRPLAGLGFDRSAVPVPFSMVAVQEQLVIDIPEVVEPSRKLAELWAVSLCNASTSNAADVASASTEDNHLEEDIPLCLKGVSREEMEIVFLGTGSSQPSKYRNVSAIYVHLFKQGGIMLDCGEGTYAQLTRRYGSVGAHEVLAGLKCVWISHIHADHHTGLARILSVRRSILERQGLFQPILVIGPKQLKRFLDAYERLEDLGMEFLDCSQTTADAERYASSEQNPFLDGSFLKEDKLKETVIGSPGSLSPRNGKNPKKGITADAENVHEGSPARIGLIQAPSVSVDKLQISRGTPISPKRSQMRNFWLQTGANLQAGIDWEGREKLRETLSVMGLAKLRSVPVVHCAHAFGVMLEAQGCVMSNGLKRPGWKLVYSGDTRPCKALVDASQGATILIHEATFDDGLLEEAEAKRHSLTKEAIETGVAAGVYRTILTHFSQRYPKIPIFDDSYTSQTCIAFDMMSVNLADLPLLPSLLPALKALFKEELLDVEEAADEHQEL
ncbi:unnamed protein product [Sphagnum jensenii]|uniref:ribonuclease Z n=1 Tax=Sphagnum jensenii TaxID=128206 RepID=A0ABP1C0U1_9BRYO